MLVTRSLYCLAQSDIPLNTWRTHFNFRNAQALTLADQKVYCASSVGLFFLDQEDNSLNKLSKIDGLSGGEITALAFEINSKTLVVGYKNGGIDLLVNNQIASINTIKEATILGSKKINQISFYQGFAYLATDFGLVVLDLEKSEIKEAYDQIGAMGNKVAVSASALWQDSLFLSTEEGIIAGSLDPQINLQDFANWRRFSLASDGLPQSSYLGIAALSNSLVTSSDSNTLFEYKESQWEELSILPDEPVIGINSSQEKVIIVLTDRLIILDPSGEISTVQEALILQPQQAALDQSGSIWVADRMNGLVSDFEGGFQSIFPSGPFSDNFWSFTSGANRSLVAVSGGFNTNAQPFGRELGFYQFAQGEWINFNNSKLGQTELSPEFKDLVDVSFNSIDHKYYFASFGDGLVQWDGTEFVLIDENTPGSPLVNSNPPDGFIRVSAARVDEEGAVWVTNYGHTSPLHRYQPSDNTWQSFSFGLAVAQYPLRLLIASNNDKWLCIDPNQGGGIILINQDNSVQRYLTNANGSGGLPSRNATAIAEDLEQTIWVGTEKGIGIFPFASALISQDQIDAIIPNIEGRPLLKDEFITCIEVDGGNRKWIGTENGVWLFTEDGDSVVHHFTSDNSPLPSDNILSIHLLQESGEVFFATTKGLVSFRSGATKASEVHQFVKIFPNPVTRDFSGEVGISGLARDAIIKITDVSGRLVTETRAQGGTAIWNVADYQGRRVASGVYLIFSSSADGDQTFVGKVAVVN
ncbi:MAG: hypothetical protein ACR2MX_03470 [Cyclobacteriaceae bacterium]